MSASGSTNDDSSSVAPAEDRGRPAGVGTGITAGTRRRWLWAALAVVVPLLIAAPGEPWWPSFSGDEPHYLVIAQSIARDGDTEVSNQYDENQYRRYFPTDLWPHAKPGIRPGSRYSMHGIGLGVWLAPWMPVTREMGPWATTMVLRAAMVVWLGLLTWVLWTLIARIGSRRAADLGVAAAIFTSPLLFFGVHLFTELPAAAISAGSFLLLRRSVTARGSPGPTACRALAGLGVAILPWLHFKYALVGAGLVLYGLVGITRPGLLGGAASAEGGEDAAGRPGPSVPVAVLTLLALPLASAIGHLAYTWIHYRSLSPLVLFIGAGEGGGRPTSFGDDLWAYVVNLPGALRTAIGYLFDQKDGLFFHAPQYLLAATGLGWMWGRRKADAVALLGLAASLWVPYALSHETGHWSPPVRPLAAVLWTLAVPMAVTLGLAVRRVALARVAGALMAWGVGMTVLHVVQADLLYHDVGVRRSLLLFRYGAPGLPLWEAFPVWVNYEEPQWIVSLAWLVAGTALGVWLWRQGEALARADVKVEMVERRDLERLPLRGGARATDPPARGPRIGRSTVAFARSALTVIVCGLLLLLAHRLLVPVTALHRDHPLGVASRPGAPAVTVKVWEPISPPQRAWPADPVGIWVGGDDTTDLLISAPVALERIVLQLRTVGPVRYRIELGDAAVSGSLPGRVEETIELGPGDGRPWGDQRFYRLRVVCDGGGVPLELGLREDVRNLGLRLRAVSASRSGDPAPLRIRLRPNRPPGTDPEQDGASLRINIQPANR